MPTLRRPPRLSIFAAALVAALLAALLLGGSARPALAHALYEKSQPASGAQLETPGQIQVWFTEPVEPELSELQVLDTARKRVDLQDTPPGARREPGADRLGAAAS